MSTIEQVQALRNEASRIGVFFPMIAETEIIGEPDTLHARPVASRRVLCMQSACDADTDGAPTDATLARYAEAVKKQQYGIVWLEPCAISAEARRYEHSLVLCEKNAEAFHRLTEAISKASEEAFGTIPVIVALLDHAGHHALTPVAVETSKALPTDARLLTDDEMTQIVLQCAEAAKAAVTAGCGGIALNAADRNLFGESLAAFHRDGKFGGDFDDRTRFVRDCYTAMKMLTGERLFYTIRLCLSDGIPQPDGWGMAFENLSAPDIYEPALLLKILQTLYGVKLVLCSIGIPDINWMLSPKRERDLIRYSRLCTCTAMLDSDMQQNVQLILPELDAEEVPFANLAAGMIKGEFASFVGYVG